MIDQKRFERIEKLAEKMIARFKDASDAWADFSAESTELGREVANEGHADAALWCAWINPARARQLLAIEALRINKTPGNDINQFPRGFLGVNEARATAARWSVEGHGDLAGGDAKKYIPMRSRLDEQRKRLFSIVGVK